MGGLEKIISGVCIFASLSLGGCPCTKHEPSASVTTVHQARKYDLSDPISSVESLYKAFLNNDKETLYKITGIDELIERLRNETPDLYQKYEKDLEKLFMLNIARFCIGMLAYDLLHSQNLALYEQNHIEFTGVKNFRTWWASALFSKQANDFFEIIKEIKNEILNLNKIEFIPIEYGYLCVKYLNPSFKVREEKICIVSGAIKFGASAKLKSLYQKYDLLISRIFLGPFHPPSHIIERQNRCFELVPHKGAWRMFYSTIDLTNINPHHPNYDAVNIPNSNLLWNIRSCGYSKDDFEKIYGKTDINIQSELFEEAINSEVQILKSVLSQVEQPENKQDSEK